MKSREGTEPKKQKYTLNFNIYSVKGWCLPALRKGISSGEKGSRSLHLFTQTFFTVVLLVL